MALKRPGWSAGTVVVLEHDSKILRDNPLGDPHVRKLAVWLPPQYNEGATRGKGQRFPALYDMVGFTGSRAGATGPENINANPPAKGPPPVHPKKKGAPRHPLSSPYAPTPRT